MGLTKQQKLDLIDRTIAFLRIGWTRYVYATNKSGYPVFPDSPQACNWCAQGAVHKASNELLGKHAELWWFRNPRVLAAMNDTAESVDEVIAYFMARRKEVEAT